MTSGRHEPEHHFLEFIFYRIFLLLLMSLVMCNTSTKCGGHGTCGEDGKCICHDGYFGSECSSKLIFLRLKPILT